MNRKGAKSYGLAPFLVIHVPIMFLLDTIELNDVGVTGFEPATTRPPDVYSTLAELHPEIWPQMYYFS